MTRNLLPLLFLSLLLVPIGANLVPTAQSYPNTWVIAFYPGSYPSGTSEWYYSSFAVNFSAADFPPAYNATNYAGFVETVYINSNVGLLGIQLILQFEGNNVQSSCNGLYLGEYALMIQIWAATSGQLLYQNYTLVPGFFVGFMNITALPNSIAHAAVGILQYHNGSVYKIYVPRYFYYNGNLIEISQSDFGGPVNPSFALEGTAYNIFDLFGCPVSGPGVGTQWDGMFINGQPVQEINAVAGHSSATGVGGTAPLPSELVESGLTLINNGNPYAWYFSLGEPSSYQLVVYNFSYVQLSVGQSYNAINYLNTAPNYKFP
mgnify:CR=1 FL=1